MYLERLGRALPEVRQRIEEACERGGRSDAAGIRLVAVTKGHPIEALEAARDAGIEIIGENRVQEAERKWEEAGDLDLSWHMVGHLQRNKVRRALDLFGLIQSVDSLRLAREIEKEAEKRDRIVPILIEVNASGEEQKYGFPVDEALGSVQEACALDRLKIMGLMTMAPLTDEEDVLRRTFRRTRDLFERCREEVEGFEPCYLSMGMTNDFEVAVEEGSSMVRLGTVLFGERPE